MYYSSEEACGEDKDKSSTVKKGRYICMELGSHGNLFLQMDQRESKGNLTAS